ncbi:hypothetical protein NPIL_543101 [Nephila pilipes]|uniref:Uncharacterized protein n=1 Tax=Nephila pilipes TaxID=299642 RepID=A0A8X6PXR1_NEPPI|nr:hypothetical protein NPIL_543101 [Nephila pilipes]
MNAHLHPDPDVSNDLSPTSAPCNYSSYRLSLKWKRIIYLRITAESHFVSLTPGRTPSETINKTPGTKGLKWPPHLPATDELALCCHLLQKYIALSTNFVPGSLIPFNPFLNLVRGWN